MTCNTVFTGQHLTTINAAGRNPDGILRQQWEDEIRATVAEFQPDLRQSTPRSIRIENPRGRLFLNSVNYIRRCVW